MWQDLRNASSSALWGGPHGMVLSSGERLNRITVSIASCPGDRVIGREAGALAIAVETPQRRPDHVEPFRLEPDRLRSLRSEPIRLYNLNREQDSRVR